MPRRSRASKRLRPLKARGSTGGTGTAVNERPKFSVETIAMAGSFKNGWARTDRRGRSTRSPKEKTAATSPKFPVEKRSFSGEFSGLIGPRLVRQGLPVLATGNEYLGA